MWVSSSLFPIIDARPQLTGFSISRTRPQSIPLIVAKMEAQSPGAADVRVVHHQDLNKRILVALVVSSTLLGAILLFLLCFWIYRRKTSNLDDEKCRKNSEGSKGVTLNPIISRFNSLRLANFKGSVSTFDYKLLEAATDSFSKNNVLGHGGSGHVYKACFNDKLLAAVKRIDNGGADAEREFENELSWLCKIRHQNVIKLLGHCIHGETQFLVYEMMHNGSLESQLHGPSRGSALTWHLRMKIAVNVARGLEYLHEHRNPPVVHRDLKSSNILLDSDFNAKLSDFGLVVNLGAQNKNIKLSGTLGYVAPEYLLDDGTDSFPISSFMGDPAAQRQIKATENCRSRDKGHNGFETLIPSCCCSSVMCTIRTELSTVSNRRSTFPHPSRTGRAWRISKNYRTSASKNAFIDPVNDGRKLNEFIA
ncbi:putative receptor-like protein kinase, partial [Cucurbita argyrosperma subsp. sororia]